jgi:DNA helicase-2/ATP-dependent DNA helicase PcrA
VSLFTMLTESDPILSSQLSREEKLAELSRRLRPGQQEMALWDGGAIAVSAVPGAGKSFGMATAAAIHIARLGLHSRKQLLVVTFTRSAAASIKQKIRDYLRELSLPPGSFVVQTLHGLALNIATRHANLSGLNLDTSTLITANQSHRLIKTCVEQWISANPRHYQTLLEGVQFDGEETERLRRQSVLRTEVLPSLTHTVVHEAKSSGLLPQDLWELSQQETDEYRLLEVAAGLYTEYEGLGKSREFIDYDDMILAALRVLEHPAIREQWQKQYFAVFEDEAQDSSPLQEKLLRILATDPENPNQMNLVRVGDPNQAINSTFTPADPVYFNQFCNSCEIAGNLAQMDQAGRSSEVIINAANFALTWVNRKWSQSNRAPLPPQDWGRQSEISSSFPNSSAPLANGGSPTGDLEGEKISPPFRQQQIKPVNPDDPQPNANPDPVGQGVEIYAPDDIYHTVDLMGKRLIKLFEANPEHNAAVLVRENRQGHFVAEQLAYLQQQHEIRIYEVGEVERHSQIPAEIYQLLLFIQRPHSPENLKSALEVLTQRQLIATQDLNALATAPEQFLYPSPLDPPQKEKVTTARRYCEQLLRSRLELPSYQLISFLGLTLRYTGSELATVQKLAERVAKQTAGNSSLAAILEALYEIVTSERFEGVEDESDDRYTQKGQITIITMHKAKGLDWDYVFLPFLHDDVIPGKPWVPTAGKFLGDFTLSEVARSRLRTSLHHQYIYNTPPPSLPNPIEAWEEACQLKKAEEYRLLYVAMTRAKRLLWMAAARKGPFRWSVFNNSNNNFQDKTPCPVVEALKREFPQAVISL